MADEKQLRRLRESVRRWNSWRRLNPFVRTDLTRADLRQLNVGKAILIDTDLSEADLSGADLSEADLEITNLREADLSGADLSLARLSNTDLTKADLTAAIFGFTSIENVDLSLAKGLDTARHHGPSHIGIDTIYRSKGKIPESFLRGCGVPDVFIEYIQSLTWVGIQFYSCFIAHSHKDKRFCERLYSDLQAKGIRTWYFPEDATWGETVWGEIEEGIWGYDRLVVVCSKNALQSGPVLKEIERGLQREDKEGRNILFPIAIDSYLFDTWEHERKADILVKVVGDFRGRKGRNDKYDKAFKKLLAALKAE